MTLSVASATECGEFAVEALDLDRQQHDLFSAAGLLFSAAGFAASLRRAASFLCPATPRQLVDSVLDVLRPLRPDAPPLREEVQTMVELLVSAGDLIELPPESGRPTRLLFLGPPSYVEKHPGNYLVMGIRPYGQSLVGTGSAPAVTYDRHLRTVEVDPSEATTVFRALGLQRISRDRWAAEPERLSAVELIDRLLSRLDVARAAGSHPGVEGDRSDVEGDLLFGSPAITQSIAVRSRLGNELSSGSNDKKRTDAGVARKSFARQQYSSDSIDVPSHTFGRGHGQSVTRAANVRVTAMGSAGPWLRRLSSASCMARWTRPSPSRSRIRLGRLVKI